MAHHFTTNQEMQSSFSDNNNNNSSTTQHDPNPNMGIFSSFHQYYDHELSSCTSTHHHHHHGEDHLDMSTSLSSNLNIHQSLMMMMGIFSNSHDSCFLTHPQINPPDAHHHDQFSTGNLSDDNNFPCNLFLIDNDADHDHIEKNSSASAGGGVDSRPPMINYSNQHEKKRKPVNDDDDYDTPAAAAVAAEESSSANSSPPTPPLPPLLSDSCRSKTRNSTRRGKKVKCSDKEEEKPKDVVHVRARRGQATDSHSLAERVRRGKINERLKCLQDIVPGCHKTMGMAVMLDEIINYVQSLQSQVEFLSMKLTAASTFYNFNAETDTMDFMQRAKAYEAVKMQKLQREGCDGIASTQLGHLDLTFGCHPFLLP